METFTATIGDTTISNTNILDALEPITVLFEHLQELKECGDRDLYESYTQAYDDLTNSFSQVIQDMPYDESLLDGYSYKLLRALYRQHREECDTAASGYYNDFEDMKYRQRVESGICSLVTRLFLDDVDTIYKTYEQQVAEVSEQFMSATEQHAIDPALF